MRIRAPVTAPATALGGWLPSAVPARALGSGPGAPGGVPGPVLLDAPGTALGAGGELASVTRAPPGGKPGGA